MQICMALSNLQGRPVAKLARCDIKTLIRHQLQVFSHTTVIVGPLLPYACMPR